jgi:hypothetical protein
MPKPLISSTLFSFPKLLLWSLPLVLFIVYTWLSGGLPAKERLVEFVDFVLKTEQEYFPTTPKLHDSTFTPDYILRVTEAEFTQSCITKSEVILINGTTPGPELRLKEGGIYVSSAGGLRRSSILILRGEKNADLQVLVDKGLQ